MFYDNFVRVCKERGTAPSRVCIEAGLGQSRAGNWKKSGALPKQDELQKLANVLRCEVADFFSDRTRKHYPTVYDALLAQSLEEDAAAAKRTVVEPDTDEAIVVRAMGSMTRRQRVDFMSLVYGFVDEHGLPDPE